MTKGGLPKLLQPSIMSQVDKAHIVLMTLYPIPVWYNSAKKFTPASTEAEKGSIFLLLHYFLNLLK